MAIRPSPQIAELIRGFLHIGIPLLAAVVLVSVTLGLSPPHDLGIVVATAAFGFIVYFKFVGTSAAEPSSLAYMILIGMGLSALLTVGDRVLSSDTATALAIIDFVVRLLTLGTFIFALEITTDELPPWVKDRLPGVFLPQSAVQSFARQRRREGSEHRADGGTDE